ncbi:PTS sugar transporter subunit IIA [Oceanobacillus neutriphilus]|uniref:PTS galactitol transporter subunit IIA n=1 Tax=Oceanobacillus neutriphilus TaxID=531815 RepID=A0ABQ2NTT1_9BACI|nr:PTS sugar transporter subunit IIA [Oceanobacillus neutriphilus]GGP10345.1 PTS galactitol transporter subunit IIA [Oceanobacillus neutriphilus]
MEFKSLFSSKLMKLNHPSPSREKLFEEVAQDLVSKGYVKSSYQEALVQREQSFPTGLRTNYCNIAIPHTDAVHVKTPFIYLVQLQDELEFKNMGNSREELNVKLIFFLGITEPRNQTILLSTLMEHFQTEDFSKIIFEERDTKQLEKKLNTFLTGGN